MYTYTRDRVGSRNFTIPTLSNRVEFTVSIDADTHGYANGRRTKWEATVTLRFDGEKMCQTRSDAAQPPGVDLETATNHDMWTVLNLTAVTGDLIGAVNQMARGPVREVLEFGRDTLTSVAHGELQRYVDFERHMSGMRWVSTPDQVIMAAGDVQVDDVVVERNYYGNVDRYAHVEDINTETRDDIGYVQFVHALESAHPTSGWYRLDTMLEVIPAPSS